MTSLPDQTTEPLEQWLMEQRWFASKSREVAGVNVLRRVPLSAAPVLDLEIVELRFNSGTHELYQLLPGEPGAVRALAELFGNESAADGVSFHGGVTPSGDIRPMGAEQSNTSIVFGEEQVLKVFRRVEPGINPELEMLRFLSTREFENIATLTGWYDYNGELMQATLGILQQFIGEARDGWQLALDDPLGLLQRLPELGAATGRMHTILASDPSDPAFAPEEPSDEALALLTATIDEQIERVFIDLPRDNPALAPILGRGEEIRDRLQLMSHVGVGGRLIRHHGDYHLGQVLLANNDWYIIDFEGEPSRPLAESRRKLSPLRDVAGMLRSFSYAKRSATRGNDLDGWERETRRAFLDAYAAAANGAGLFEAFEDVGGLMRLFELEKVLYELRYELGNRPDWVQVPLAGLLAMLEKKP